MCHQNVKREVVDEIRSKNSKRKRFAQKTMHTYFSKYLHELTAIKRNRYLKANVESERHLSVPFSRFEEE